MTQPDRQTSSYYPPPHSHIVVDTSASDIVHHHPSRAATPHYALQEGPSVASENPGASNVENPRTTNVENLRMVNMENPGSSNLSCTTAISSSSHFSNNNNNSISEQIEMNHVSYNQYLTKQSFPSENGAKCCCQLKTNNNNSMPYPSQPQCKSDLCSSYNRTNNDEVMSNNSSGVVGHIMSNGQNNDMAITSGQFVTHHQEKPNPQGMGGGGGDGGGFAYRESKRKISNLVSRIL